MLQLQMQANALALQQDKEAAQNAADTKFFQNFSPYKSGRRW
jgi:hypothetical protein